MTTENKTQFVVWAGLAGRIAVGLVLAYAGFLKAVAPAEEFAYAMETYKVFPQWVITIASLTVPWAEIYLGLFLAAGLFARQTAALTGALIVFFQVLLGQAMLRGLPITSCGCFGSGKSNSIGMELAQNFILLALTAAAYAGGRDKLSLDLALEHRHRAETTKQEGK